MDEVFWRVYQKDVSIVKILLKCELKKKKKKNRYLIELALNVKNYVLNKKYSPSWSIKF